MSKTFIETGVMVMNSEGKAWGVTHEDGRSRSEGWMPAVLAPIHDPRYCKRPEDVTYSSDPNRKRIRKGKLVHVTRTTSLEVDNA